jgi:hypothetical protein
VAGDRFGEPPRVGEEFFHVHAHVVTKEAWLYAAVVVDAQGPETLDAPCPLRASSALAHVVATEITVDHVDFDAIDAEDPAALSDAGYLCVLLAGERAQVGHDGGSRHR